MKKHKLFALGMSALLALSLFAGCADTTPPENGGTNPPDSGTTNPPDTGTTNPPDGKPVEIPTPDALSPAFSDEAVTLNLNASVSTQRRVSESLFGVFLEDINYAGYLLDDNLLVNGSFETFGSNKTYGWTASGATLNVKNTDGVLKGTSYASQSVNANYAEVIANAGGVISNAGHTYLPIAVEKDGEYLFSAFVKSGKNVNLTVRVKSDSVTYAEKVVAVKAGSGWVKYQATLKASETAASGLRFEIAFDESGTYLLDGIQLETLNATGGIKQYVYDAIEELAPRFVRFPGGCIIEGDSAAGGANCTEIYDWKNSIGAVQNGTNAGDDTIPAFEYTLVKDGEESTATSYGEWITRKQNGDLWGYDMEYGVGFYEYFLLCDNLGASAVPVVNCGLSDQGGAASGDAIALNGRHGKKVEDYIQDAINLIEFAKGDKTTKWGALRAAMGHEEPFAMDYIGIGNEQSGVYFEEYYEKFLLSKAFKDALNDYNVKPIVGNGMFLENCQDPDADNGRGKMGTAQEAANKAMEAGVVNTVAEYGVHDQHYYVNWTELFEHYDLYNRYARPSASGNSVRDKTYYEVFVGEYSANTGAERASGYPLYENSLITALSEAAMMTGMERNGDIVKLAAYAPMFGVANTNSRATTGGNSGANQWPVDMMYFTNEEIVRSANYYVQKMFMHHQGDYVLTNASLTGWNEESTFAFPMEGATGGRAKTLEKLYYVVSRMDDGDIIVKVVNASSEPIKLNIDIKNAESYGFAYVTEMYDSNYKAINTLANSSLKPVEHSVGWEGNSFGYELKGYSVTVLRILAE